MTTPQDAARGPAGPSVTEQVPAAFAALWDRARPRLVERVRALEQAAAELERGPLGAATREQAREEAHKLAGSLGTYGLMSGSGIAREVELRLENVDPLQPKEALWLRQRVDALTRLVHQAAVAAPPIAEAPLSPPTPDEATDASTPAPRAARHTALQRVIQDLRRSLASIEHAAAERVRSAANKTPPTTESEAEARLAARRILEALAAIGATDAALHAREAATLLGTVSAQDTTPRLADAVIRLDETLRRLANRQPTPEAGRVVLRSDDPRWAREVAAAIELRGHPVTIAPSDAGPLPPRCALVLQDGGTSTPRTGPSSGTGAPIIIALHEPSLAARLEAARAGADRVIARAAPPHEIATLTDLLISEQETTTGTILVVDDDQALLAAVASTLRAARFDVHTLDAVETVWERLEDVAPDLIITDLDMPNVNGAELCQALRTDPRWAHLPVVFLSASADERHLRLVFEAGADDFLAKPVPPDLLVARIRARLQRTHARSASSHLDPGTRLVRGAALMDALERLFKTHRGSRSPLTLAVIRLAARATEERPQGRGAQDRRLARLARQLVEAIGPHDLAGRLDDDAFVLALIGQDAHDARRRLERLTARVADPGNVGTPAHVAVGIADVKHASGTGVQELLALARHASIEAGRAGHRGIQVAGLDEDAQAAQKIDVLIVDDDETIGELLLAALSDHGWSVAWVKDGTEAVRRLAGGRSDMVPRLILLDVNLPGLDGLSVLRSLREHGVVPRSQVIMLTVRAREDEVVRALDLGATDHVAKPFSIPVLITRIARILKE